MEQNATSWTPTRQQVAVLEAAQDARLNRSLQAICKTAGVARTSLWRWLTNDAQFRAAWEEIRLAPLRRNLPGIAGAVAVKALRGDVPAARLAFEATGVLKQRHEHTGPGGGPIRVATQEDYALADEIGQDPEATRLANALARRLADVRDARAAEESRDV